MNIQNREKIGTPDERFGGRKRFPNMMSVVTWSFGEELEIKNADIFPQILQNRSREVQSFVRRRSEHSGFYDIHEGSNGGLW